MESVTLPVNWVDNASAYQPFHHCIFNSGDSRGGSSLRDGEAGANRRDEGRSVAGESAGQTPVISARGGRKLICSLHHCLIRQ